MCPRIKRKEEKGKQKYPKKARLTFPKAKARERVRRESLRDKMIQHRRQEAKEKARDPRHGPPQTKYPLRRLPPP